MAHVAVLARKCHPRGALPAVVEAAVMGRNKSIRFKIKIRFFDF